MNGGGGGIVTFSVDDDYGAGYHSSVASIFNARGLKYTWFITSQLGQTHWTEVNSVIAANQVIGFHTRSHDQLASGQNGSDITNALAINYNGGTTVTASYTDPTFTLTVDGSSTTINVSTENARTCGVGTYDTTILGDATHGLIGCIKALSANYTVAFPSTQAASINETPGSASPNTTSSRVLADQGPVNIKSPNCPTTTGCIALDSTRLFNRELFTAGQRDGEYADWDAQTGAISGYSTVSFAYPFGPYSTADIARLYARGIKAARAVEYCNSYLVAQHYSLNQLYPLAMPTAYPGATDQHSPMQTTQDGIDEAENVAAVLSTYPTMFNLFGHSSSDVSLDALTSFVDTLRSHGVSILSMADAVAQQEAAGGVWDTTSYHITRKIVPVYDLHIPLTSPAIEAGTNLSLTQDLVGNPIYGTPDIGGYEYQPPHDLAKVTPDKIDIGAGARIYGDGKFRDKGTTNSTLADLKITPSGGTFSETTSPISAWLDVTGITHWTNTWKTWTEGNAKAGLTTTDHIIGDLDHNAYYNITVSGIDALTYISGATCQTVGSNRVCKSDNDGKISFTYSGGYSDHEFDMTLGDNIAPTTTATPAGGLSGSAQSVTLTCADNGGGSGCASIHYSTNGTDYSVYTTDPVSISSTTTLYFYSVDNNGNSETPKTETYTIDTTPPDTLIDTEPINPTHLTSAAFTFHATETSTFQCKLDSGDYSLCSSPQNYAGLSESSHTFYVKATDTAGNEDPSLASFTWTIDTTAPDTTINSHPLDQTNSTSANFTFSSESNATFKCKIDSGSYSDCSSPQSYGSLTSASHTFYVKATDQAGNEDPSPASFTWTIDTTAPLLSEFSPVSTPTNNPTPSYTFHTNEAGMISYGGGCVSGDTTTLSGNKTITFNALLEGSYGACTITVADAAGNASLPFTISTFIIDTTPPTTTASPHGGTYGAACSVTLSCGDGSGGGCDKIYYTTSGDDPDASSPVYSSLISVSTDTTLKFFAKDRAGNTEAPFTTETYIIDTSYPVTDITSKPASYSNSDSATFVFHANKTSTFQCQLDSGTFADCTSPQEYSALSEGAHTFTVKATDMLGHQEEPTPPSYSWTVDTTAPHTSISSHPNDSTNATTASFTFSANESSTFKCKLDNGSYSTCATPKDYAGLSEGSYTFSVKATDLAGKMRFIRLKRTSFHEAP